MKLNLIEKLKTIYAYGLMFIAAPIVVAVAFYNYRPGDHTYGFDSEEE